MKKTLFFAAAMLIMLALPFRLHAQGTDFYDLSGGSIWPSEANLICSLNDGRVVVYKKNFIGHNRKELCLIDTSSLISKKIFLPDSLNINDITLMDNTILFCGNISGRATCGFLPISEFTSSTTTASVNYFQIPPNQTRIFTNFFKIKYFNINHLNTIHFVMIGEYSSSSGTNRCVVNLTTWTDESFFSTHHKLSYMEDSGLYEWFNDIIVTDNYVFTVAQKKGGNGIYFRRFTKPSSGVVSIFYSGSHHILHSFSLSTNDTTVTCRLTHIQHDSLAVAAIGYFNNHYGLTVGLINGSTFTPYDWFQPFYTSEEPITPWKIRDFDLGNNYLRSGNIFYSIVDTGSEIAFVYFEHSSPHYGSRILRPGFSFNSMDGHFCACTEGSATLINGLQLLIPDKCFKKSDLFPYNFVNEENSNTSIKNYHFLAPTLTFLTANKTTSSIIKEKCLKSNN